MIAKLIVSSLILTSCASRFRRNQDIREGDRQKISDELSQEMSLKEDREALSAARSDIPPEVQKSNDELALFLNLMGQNKERPELVRDRFSVLVQRRRVAFREKVERLRQDYRTDETRRREDFVTAQQKKRERFMSGKHDPRKSSRFSSDQERERVQFFADERDRRSSFESELSAQSRDFDSYMRERQNEFNEQFRLYSKRFSEKPKAKNAVTGDEMGSGE